MAVKRSSESHPKKECQECHEPAIKYIRAKVDQLLNLMGTLPLRPEELDNATLIDLDPIGIVAGSFEQVLAHLKQTNHELTIARNEIRSVFDALGAAVIVVNKDNIIEDCNTQAREWFFHVTDAAKVVGRPLSEASTGHEQLWVTELVDNQQISEFIYATRHYQRVSSMILNETGQAEKIVHMCFDITVQKRAEEILRAQATTDTLTGIANRRKLYAMLSAEIGRAGRYNLSLSAMMLDIDHFKQVNDMLGHLVGDDVLVDLVSMISGMIREQDIFARWGGEEFIILVPNRNLEETRHFAEKLRHAVEIHSFPTVGAVTCSFGVAEYQPRESIEAFFQRVDAALYRAKENGRNRVELA